jgi:hypothetical protein
MAVPARRSHDAITLQSTTNTPTSPILLQPPLFISVLADTLTKSLGRAGGSEKDGYKFAGLLGVIGRKHGATFHSRTFGYRSNIAEV